MELNIEEEVTLNVKIKKKIVLIKKIFFFINSLSLIYYKFYKVL